jgi:hypothetical protein
MSHFNHYTCKLNTQDLQVLKPVFQSLATQFSLQLVERQTVTNRYDVSTFMLLGLKGDIPPVGLTLGANDTLNLTVDWETNHGGTNQKVTEVYTTLINQLSEYRTKKALTEATSVAQKHGANVNVVVHH